ncbi:Cyclin-dependent kinase inhibitor 3 [Sesamum alatum]|uniref:Cyclin-dependent kinase inhibitor n=1 Tax=Sesamum alatum TaxID=300844 RepID=A0AAE2D0N7_9LAMI|nr:Cyclin-dependent kinase inhibitor 3 [Sesamum alatum]
MGKYTRKAKMTADVALMDVSQSYLGVRTRAKTLALQRLQSAAANPDACYLELRSRRLEKPMQQQNSRQSCGCRGKEEDLEVGNREECFQTGVILGSIEAGGLGIEVSFGENVLDIEAAERGTRESTPCSLIRAADTITPPGSTTKQTCSSAPTERAQDVRVVNVPSSRDLEDFFAREEQLLQRHFVEKYNFDIMNDLPLPGRYEWVAVRP